jgi:hypothetical protein
MDYNKKQDIIENKRKELIEVVNSMGCSVYEAVGFAIQEHFLGIPFKNDYSDDDQFEESFKQIYLRRDNNHSKELVYSKTMTEVLEHLYSKQISNTYVEIKKFVYARLEEELAEGSYWGTENFDWCDEFKDWLWFMEEKLHDEIMDTLVDNNWNILTPKKEKKNKIK